MFYENYLTSDFQQTLLFQERLPTYQDGFQNRYKVYCERTNEILTKSSKTYYKCGLCDKDYVGFTSRHLRQRVEEHKRSTIGNHVKDEHGKDPETIASNFKILKKCQSKLDCLIFEMFFIRDLKQKLNKLCDSIRAKLFI